MVACLTQEAEKAMRSMPGWGAKDWEVQCHIPLVKNAV